MAAEGVGLAASVAGLLSLGLQITSGIVKYLDAFENRQEELAYVRQQNDALTATLLAIETASSDFQGQRPEFTAAVSQSIQSCETELNAAEALRVDLADCDRSTWTTRLENKKKKLTYAFHRSKVQQLAQRLQQANEVLQLALTGLGLEISRLNTNKLTAIESSSQAHASELLLIRSEVAVVGAPVASIRDQLPLLQGSVDTTAHLVGVIAHEIPESNQAIRQDVQRYHESTQLQFRQHQEALGKVEQLLKKLQRQGEQSQSKETLAARAAGKPAALKELCDSIQASKQSHRQSFQLDQTACRSQDKAVSPFRSSRLTSITGRVCICHHPHWRMARTGIQLGHVYLSSEWETQGHWPSCPLSETARKNRRAVNLKYTGLARTLKSIINVSFAWTSGAGGFSISPNFAYYPTVDVKSDPAFRILRLIRSYLLYSKLGNREPFIVACLGKLVRLFDEKKAYPTVVSDRNESLMHYAADVVRLLILGMTCMLMTDCLIAQVRNAVEQKVSPRDEPFSRAYSDATLVWCSSVHL
ncbi:hypothetical protein F4677DRAFT_415538 [Hypoxylon crocopeplum]|nr:hypothetical protein F4677DRAFT_415538 [Hypoxylon crocopeplum]